MLTKMLKMQNINHNVKAKYEYAHDREVMTNPLTPLSHQIVVARQQLSLMGGIFMPPRS
jgi:hypothetical protein